MLIANDTFSHSMRSKLIKHGLCLYSHVQLSGSFLFESPVTVYSQCALQSVSLGAYSYVNADSRLCTTSVGRYSSIGDGVNIGLIKHEMQGLTTSPTIYRDGTFSFALGDLPVPHPALARHASMTSKVTIGHDVWVGSQVTIPSDVTIGTGAVIGAAAVVTHDVPPYAIVAGNPARIIRYRFKDEIIADLLESKWWCYDWPRLRKNHDLPLEDVQAFLKFFKELDLKKLPAFPEHYLSLEIKGPERCTLSKVNARH